MNKNYFSISFFYSLLGKLSIYPVGSSRAIHDFRQHIKKFIFISMEKSKAQELEEKQ
jgi:hypothetical protein